MGVGESQNTVFLIDFGIAQQYRDPSSRIHVPKQEIPFLVGTPAFASINSHRGLQLGRRDDVESLVYSLIFLHRGSLPWLTRAGKSPSVSTILASKQAFLTDSGAHDIPIALAEVLRHARGLAFTERPNYGHLCTVLRNAVEAPQPPSSHRLTHDSHPPVSTSVVSIAMPVSKPMVFAHEEKANNKVTPETRRKRQR